MPPPPQAIAPAPTQDRKQKKQPQNVPSTPKAIVPASTTVIEEPTITQGESEPMATTTETNNGNSQIVPVQVVAEMSAPTLAEMIANAPKEDWAKLADEMQAKIDELWQEINRLTLIRDLANAACGNGYNPQERAPGPVTPAERGRIYYLADRGNNSLEIAQQMKLSVSQVSACLGRRKK